MSSRTGAVFRPDFPPASLRTVAAAADAAGVDELWLWEDCFQQGGVAQAAVALSASERLVVGVGLIPAPLRNVASTAMEFATLEAMFPGRIRIGIGHGVQDWMRQAGAAVASPMTLLREYVLALRALFAGETVTVDGRYVRLSEVALEYAPPQHLPVLIGGTGAKTLRLAGEIADGVILDSGYTRTSVCDALAEVAAGRAGRTTAFSTVGFVACVPGDGSAAQLAKKAATFALTPEDGFGVGGTASDIVAGLAPYLDAGMSTPVLQPLGPVDTMAEFVTVCGEVAALIDSRADQGD
jgi:alkanesulfonate monooxygenase SsuD/methylene tetrahydromethanopterin reductase-like flavin-dependent oxidoreductase (luciferase family)